MTWNRAMKPLLKRDLSWFCDPDGTLTSGLILVIRDLEEGGCCEVIGSARNFNFLLASRTPLLKRKTNNGSEKKKSFVGFLFVSFSTLGDFFFFSLRGDGILPIRSSRQAPSQSGAIRTCHASLPRPCQRIKVVWKASFASQWSFWSIGGIEENLLFQTDLAVAKPSLKWKKLY